MNKITMALIVAMMLIVPRIAGAHCDSLAGPVILEARAALEQKDVTRLLKWVRPQDEAQIREAFNRALAVRQLGPEAKELADNYFFETLVRIHRAGEGAPYSGIKPADSILPAVQEADNALDSGSVDKLAAALSQHTAQGLRERYARTVKAKAEAGKSVKAGREYVEAYVNYVHYVEALANVVHGTGHHEEATEGRHP